jgi:hypothetical protein
MTAGEVEYRITIKLNASSIRTAFDNIAEKLEPLIGSVQCKILSIYFYDKEVCDV